MEYGREVTVKGELSIGHWVDRGPLTQGIQEEEVTWRVGGKQGIKVKFEKQTSMDSVLPMFILQ